jgi:hypothetical protein
MKGISHEALKISQDRVVMAAIIGHDAESSFWKGKGPGKVAEAMLGMTLDRRTSTGSNRCVRLSGGQTDTAGVSPIVSLLHAGQMYLSAAHMQACRPELP